MSLAVDNAELPALKRDLRRAESRRRWLAMGMVAPLFLFLILTFALPILDMLRRAPVLDRKSVV